MVVAYVINLNINFYLYLKNFSRNIKQNIRIKQLRLQVNEDSNFSIWNRETKFENEYRYKIK